MTREGQPIRTALRAKLLAQRREFDTFKARAAVAEAHGFELTLAKHKVAARVYWVFWHADSAGKCDCAAQAARMFAPMNPRRILFAMNRPPRVRGVACRQKILQHRGPGGARNG